MTYSKICLFVCITLFITASHCFINNIIFKTEGQKSTTTLNKYKKERNVYSRHLIGLRKQQRKIFPKNININIDTIEFFMNLTKQSSENYNYTTINNTNMCAEKIIMGNIILDVSEVKYIHISTEKEHIKIKLDNNSKNSSISSTNLIYNGLQNIDIIFTTVQLVGKFININ